MPGESHLNSCWMRLVNFVNQLSFLAGLLIILIIAGFSASVNDSTTSSRFVGTPGHKWIVSFFQAVDRTAQVAVSTCVPRIFSGLSKSMVKSTIYINYIDCRI